MLSALNAGASGLIAATRRQAATAHNIANVLTPGFKRRDTVSASAGVPPTSGVRIAATRIDGSQGPLISTGSGLDVAIAGEGFFKLDTPAGPRFTRRGTLAPSANGQLVDVATGFPVNPAINIPPEARSVSVSPDGQVLGHLPGGETAVLGQIQLVRFNNAGGLEETGAGLLAQSPASGGPQAVAPGETGGRLLSGFLEGSNTDLVRETVAQIGNRAAFSANLRTIRTADEMLGELLDSVG